MGDNTRKNIKISPSSFQLLNDAKIYLDISSYDQLFSFICSKDNLYFIKTYGAVDEPDIRNFISGRQEEIKKFIQKQIGRPIAILQNHEKYYLGLLTAMNEKIDDLRVDLKIENRKNENQKEDKIPQSFNNNREIERLEKQKEEFKNDVLKLSDEVQELENKIEEIKSLFKKKSGMFGGGEVFEALLQKEEFFKIFS